MNAYDTLETIFFSADTLAEVLSVLHWDMAAMMPRGGAARRAEQLSAVKSVHHRIMTDPRMADLL